MLVCQLNECIENFHLKQTSCLDMSKDDIYTVEHMFIVFYTLNKMDMTWMLFTFFFNFYQFDGYKIEFMLI